jgi:hypothetical protein
MKEDLGQGTATDNTTQPAAGTTTTTDAAAPSLDAKAPEVGAEAKYEFKFADGQEPDTAVLGKFTGMAKELGIAPEKAQGLVDLAGELVKNNTEAQQKQWEGVREQWVGEIKTDKEFGGDRLPETLERGKRVLRDFGSPEIVDFLNSTGYGDNPSFIKMLARLDKALGETRTISGTPASGAKDAASVLFG